MTGKRFTLKEYVFNHYAILDNGEEFAYVDHKSAFSICELLNELHEENKELKDFAQHNYSETKKIINNLQKENEQLKQLLLQFYTEDEIDAELI